MATVLMTDYAWEDVVLERGIIEGAGHSLVVGPAKAAPPDAIAGLARRHRPHAIMTCWAEVDAAAIAACPDIKIVARIGVGLDNIDRVAAARQGAVVTNVPDYCVEEVSDHAVGMLLAWARGLIAFDRESKAGTWNPAGAQLRRVRDMTVGLAGFGRIGRRTAEKLRPFGVRLLALAPRGPTIDKPAGIAFVDLATLVRESDALILHLPLTAATQRLFGAKILNAMKPGSFLINVSRGGLVDNAALLDAVDRGLLAGAALDVIDGEPEPPQALLAHPRIIVTPHVAFSSQASLLELRRRAAEEVVRVLAGRPPAHPCAPPGME